MSSTDHSRMIKIPMESISVPNESVIYNLQIDEKEGKQSLLSIRHTYDNLHDILIKSSAQIMFKEPIYMHQEIDLDEWEKSLKYNKTEVDGLLSKILIDFGLEPTPRNMNWLRDQFYGLISLYGDGSDKRLPDETRSMLVNLIIRMAYDNLCVNTPT